MERIGLSHFSQTFIPTTRIMSHKFALHIFFSTKIFLLIIIKINPTPTVALALKPQLSAVIETLISPTSATPELSQCSLFLVDVGVGSEENRDFDLNSFLHYLSSNLNPIPNFYVTLPKNGTNSRIRKANSIFSTQFDTSDMIHHWTYSYKRVHVPYCSLVVSFLSSGLGQRKDKQLEGVISTFYSQVVTGLPGLVNKELDYFLFLGGTLPLIESVLSLDSLLCRRVKYRVGLVVKTGNNPDEEVIDEGVSACCGVNSGLASKSGIQKDKEFVQVLGEGLVFNRMRNMFGATLLVSTPLSTRWLNEMVQSPNGDWIPKRGPYKLVLNILESTLNFTSSHFPSTGGGTGALVNGSVWIGTVGDVLQARADLGHVTAETWSRSRVVDHSFPISHEWLTFSTGEPRPYYSWKAIGEPLNIWVWSLVVVALVVSWTVFFLLVTVHHMDPGSSLEKSFRHGWKLGFMLAEYVLGTLLDQAPRSPTEVVRSKSNSVSASGALRNFTIAWLTFTLLISTAYRSKLVTFLAFPNVDPPPDSFEALAKSSYKIGLQYIKGAAYQVFKNSKNPTYSKIFKRMSLESEDVNCFLAAIKSRFACISWDSIAEFVKHRNLTDVYGRSPVVKSPSSTLNINAGLVMEKRAVFKEEINHVLRWITDTGILTKIRALDFQFIRSQRNEWLKSGRGRKVVVTGGGGNSGAKPLTLAHFIGSFYLFGVCSLGCCLAFWGEFAHFWRMRRKIDKEFRLLRISIQAVSVLNEGL